MQRNNQSKTSLHHKKSYKRHKPAKSTKSYKNYFAGMDNSDAKQKTKHEIVWELLKLLSPTLKRNVPTWTSYISLIGTSHAIATVSMLPVVNGNPTDWENLYWENLSCK